jgi:hypothetical protein
LAKAGGVVFVVCLSVREWAGMSLTDTVQLPQKMMLAQNQNRINESWHFLRGRARSPWFKKNDADCVINDR